MSHTTVKTNKLPLYEEKSDNGGNKVNTGCVKRDQTTEQMKTRCLSNATAMHGIAARLPRLASV